MLVTPGNLYHIFPKLQVWSAVTNRNGVRHSLDCVGEALLPRVSSRLLKHVPITEPICCYSLLLLKHTEGPGLYRHDSLQPCHARVIAVGGQPGKAAVWMSPAGLGG